MATWKVLAILFVILLALFGLALGVASLIDYYRDRNAPTIGFENKDGEVKGYYLRNGKKVYDDSLYIDEEAKTSNESD